MKARQWGRLYRSTYGKPRPWTYNFLVFYIIAYVIYLFLELEYFYPTVWITCTLVLILQTRTSHTIEYVLMGVWSLATGYLSPGFGWAVRVLLLECYVSTYCWFLFDLLNKPELYVTVGCSVGGVIFLTIINWMFFPIILRFVSFFAHPLVRLSHPSNFSRAWYSCTGTFSPQILVESEDEGIFRCEIEETHLFSPNTKCIYEGPLKDGKLPVLFFFFGTFKFS